MKNNIKNAFSGKRVSCKMIIFESDDWGSSYFESKEHYSALIKSGTITSKNRNGTPIRYDSIARAEDLEILYETLNSVKDANGNPAVFSAFFSPTNPDFEKIAKDDFQIYHYENFFQTLARTGEDVPVATLWKEGMDLGIISPAYHAREHLCVPLWMEYLSANHEKVRKAFNQRFYSINIDTLPPGAKGFRPALYFNDFNQMKVIGEALTDGIYILNELFRKPFSVFAPPNGVSHPYFDALLKKHGIVTVHNNRRFEPNGHGGGRKRKVHSEKKNTVNTVYYNRNCRFEPVQIKDDLSKCMSQIQSAFNWNKPAIISTHRVNYIGVISTKNRDVGVSQLKQLLDMIVQKWPDAIFVSSENYSSILHNSD